MPLTPFEIQLLEREDRMDDEQREKIRAMIKDHERMRTTFYLDSELAQEKREEQERLKAQLVELSAPALLEENARLLEALRDIANLLPERSRLGKDAANFVIEDVGRRARAALGKAE